MKSKKLKKKPKGLSGYKKDLDDIYSLYIRQKYADWAGYVSCVTCGKTAHYKDGMQNGHYEKRSHNNTRFDDQNCHVQCKKCNMFMGGNYTSYALFMHKTYGQKAVEELHKRAQVSKRFTINEIKELISYYSNLVEK